MFRPLPEYVHYLGRSACRPLRHPGHIDLLFHSFHFVTPFDICTDNMANYTPRTLYEQSFNMDFQWDKHLEPSVHKFHDLMRRELNTPVELQMGTILPFIAACAGPTTRSLFFTQPSVLNLFWMNIAASGVGKSQSRKKFIAEPLEFMMRVKDIEVPDFEVCSFTRAGKYTSYYSYLQINLHKSTTCTYAKTRACQQRLKNVCMYDMYIRYHIFQYIYSQYNFQVFKTN